MDIATIFQPFIVVKIATLFFLAGYVVFTFVVYSQIKSLNRVISQSSSPLLKRISLIHAIISISLFLLAIVIL